MRSTTGRQNDDEALLGESLGDGPADAPADADGDVAIVERLAVRQFGVAAIGLPLGGGPDHHGDLLAGRAHARFLTRRYWQLAAFVNTISSIGKRGALHNRDPGGVPALAGVDFASGKGENLVGR